MQSCSIHHHVLFLLTLTFIAAPVIPITVKLHQPVTLPCEHKCSLKLAQWRLKDDRDVVFARCDQTSCSSLKGYEMSHDHYLDGDLSLTITKPDYSMRNTYVCECDNTDYTTWHLRISTVFSLVQMRSGEDLKLDLSVPEPVEVIYRGSDSADDVQICTVTQRALQCDTEHTPRTSLSNSELTLRDVQRSESGTYTIRNLDYKEDIRVYAVSVSGLTSGETAGIVIAVLMLVVLAIIGVVFYMKRKAAREEEEADEMFNMISDQSDVPQPLCTPSKPYNGPISGSLRPGMALFFQGVVKSNCYRFDINLKASPRYTSDIVFHFNPRMNYVVLNSLKNGRWGEEEHHRCPFVRGKAFEIIMVIKPECYEVKVDGQEHCTFNHRVPVESVTALNISGDVFMNVFRIIKEFD